MSLISVAREDLAVGMPLPWVLHDQDGNVLMQEGEILESEEQRQVVLASHPMRELRWNPATSDPGESGQTTEEELEAALGDETADSGITFQDMRLRVGDRVQLQPPATVSSERHIVKLIGYLENASLLVTAPLVNGLRLPLRENDKLVARIFSGQKAFGFSCFVQRVCKIPYDYLHLSFPDQIQGSIIRRSPRVRTRIIASIAKPDAADGNERQSGIIVNLSADGALLKVREPVQEVGTGIQVSFRVNLHKVDAYLTIGAIIRSTYEDEEKDDGSATMFNHGLQFVDLQANDSVILQSLIYQQMIEQPHSMT